MRHREWEGEDEAEDHKEDLDHVRVGNRDGPTAQGVGEAENGGDVDGECVLHVEDDEDG